MKTIFHPKLTTLACMCFLIVVHAAPADDVGSFQSGSTPAQAQSEDWTHVRGETTAATFTTRDPLTSPENIAKRGITENTTYDVSTANYAVYIPKNYDGTTPFGLLVCLDDRDPPRTDALIKTADTHNCVIVGISGNGLTPAVREARSVDAVYNLKKLFKIDNERVYAIGFFEGGFSASQLAQQFPDVFGGGLYCYSAIYYHYALAKPGIAYNTFMMPPELIDLSNHHGRHVFFTGRGDESHAGMIRVSDDMKKAVAHVTVLDDPDLAPRALPGDDWLEKAMQALDAPLADDAKKIFDEATMAEQHEQFGVALMKYRTAIARGIGADWASQASDRAKDLGDKADALVADATAAYNNGDYAKAAAILRDLNRQYAPAIPDAGKVLSAKLAADPNAKKSVAASAQHSEQERREVAAEAALNTAHQTLASDLAEGYQALVAVASTYAQTKAGSDADTEAKAIWADPAKRKQIEPLLGAKEAAGMLTLAKEYLANGEADQAKTKLQALIEKYPQTPSAAEARDLLAKIQ